MSFEFQKFWNAKSESILDHIQLCINILYTSWNQTAATEMRCCKLKTGTKQFHHLRLSRFRLSQPHKWLCFCYLAKNLLKSVCIYATTTIWILVAVLFCLDHLEWVPMSTACQTVPRIVMMIEICVEQFVQHKMGLYTKSRVFTNQIINGHVYNMHRLLHPRSLLP